MPKSCQITINIHHGILKDIEQQIHLIQIFNENNKGKNCNLRLAKTYNAIFEYGSVPQQLQKLPKMESGILYLVISITAVLVV